MTNADILKWILAVVSKCKTLEEFKETILNMLHNKY